MSSNTCTMNVRIGRRGKQGISDSKQTYVPCPRVSKLGVGPGAGHILSLSLESTNTSCTDVASLVDNPTDLTADCLFLSTSDLVDGDMNTTYFDRMEYSLCGMRASCAPTGALLRRDLRVVWARPARPAGAGEGPRAPHGRLERDEDPGRRLTRHGVAQRHRDDRPHGREDR